MTPRRKRPTPEQPPPDRPPAGSPGDDRDVVDESSDQSFPASDSPAWGPLHPGKPGKHPDRNNR